MKTAPFLLLPFLVLSPVLPLGAAGVIETRVLRDLPSITLEASGFELGGGLSTRLDLDPKGGDFFLDFGRSLPAGATGLALLGREGSLGKAAEFLQPENALRIPVPAHPFFTRFPDLGAFTVEFRLMLYDAGASGPLVSRMGSAWDASGSCLRSQGFQVELRRGKLAARFENFFQSRGRFLSVELDRGFQLEPDRWYHAALRYDGATGLLEKRLDGIEEDRRYATSDGSDQGVLYGAGFLPGHRAPLVLGEGFTGRLEGLRISAERGRRTVVNPLPDSISAWTSTVLSLKPWSRLRRIALGPLEGRSTAELRVRTAPERFLAEDTRLAWKPVPVNAPIPEGLLEDGRYAQVRLVVRNQGLARPNRIDALTLEYEADEVPTAPELLSVVARNGAAELVWQVGTEDDLAGYRIWWLPAGANLTKKSAQKAAVPLPASLRAADAESARMAFRVEGLENGVCYQIAVTAWDRRGESHESSFSRVVQVTPDRFAE